MSSPHHDETSLELYADLIAWLEGGAPSANLQRLERDEPQRLAHLRTAVERLLGLFTERPLAADTDAQRRRALALLAAPRTGVLEGVRTLIARLAGGAPEPAVAVRSGDAAAPLLALYEAEGFDLDVSLSEGGELVGQILPRDAERNPFEAGAALWQGGDGAPQVVPIDEDGLFHFARPGRGRGRLVLSGRDLEVVVPELELPRS